MSDSPSCSVEVTGEWFLPVISYQYVHVDKTRFTVRHFISFTSLYLTYLALSLFSSVYLTSPHFTSFYLTLPHFTSFYLSLPHFTSLLIPSKMRLKKNLMVTEYVVGLLVKHKSTYCQRSVPTPTPSTAPQETTP